MVPDAAEVDAVAEVFDVVVATGVCVFDEDELDVVDELETHGLVVDHPWVFQYETSVESFCADTLHWPLYHIVTLVTDAVEAVVVEPLTVPADVVEPDDVVAGAGTTLHWLLIKGIWSAGMLKI